MNERKVPFGLRNGVLHYVSEVENGVGLQLHLSRSRVRQTVDRA